MSVDDDKKSAAHLGLPWPQAYQDVRGSIHEQWGVAGDIYLSRQLSGKSGALVYEADLVSRDFTGQAILKLDQSADSDWQEDDEAKRHKRAFELSPDFASEHLPRIIHTLHHGNYFAILSTIAARGLEYVTPWAACPHDRQLDSLARLSRELLEDWNRDYQIAPGMLLPQDLLRGWLDYRLDPERSRLHTFLTNDCGLGIDEPSLIFQGHWYPNPMAFASSTSNEMERLRLRAVVGQIHGDLHGFNMLLGASRDDDESYFLIDLANYEDNQFLFFDHAYFAFSHLLAARGEASAGDWDSILDQLADRYQSKQDRHLRGDDLGLFQLLQTLHKELFDWVDRHQANRLSYMENQFLLANVAVGVNFASKGISHRLRQLGFIYAASYLRSYLERNRVDWPTHGPQFVLSDSTSPGMGALNTQEDEHPPLPDKPGIAVLAFDNLSGNPDEEYFADGMTQEIIAELSRIDWLMVISCGSSFAYKSRETPVKQVARELGVHYVVEGSVRRADNKVRVTAQLTDAIDGQHLWADRYQRNLEDVFALQEEIAGAIVANIDYELKLVEGDHASRKRGHVSTWDKFQKGMWHFYKFTELDASAAMEQFSDLVKQSPGFAPAQAALSLVASRHILLGELGDEEKLKELLEKTNRHAAQAVAADDSNSLAHMAFSRALMLHGEHDRAIEEGEIAVNLNPSSSGARLMLAQALVWAGRVEEALPILDLSIRLSPKGPFLEFKKLAQAVALYYLGELDKAEQAARSVVHGHRIKYGGLIVLAATLARQDRLEEAGDAIQALLRIRPKLTASRLTTTWRGMSPSIEASLTEGLRKAGLPD